MSTPDLNWKNNVSRISAALYWYGNFLNKNEYCCSIFPHSNLDQLANTARNRNTQPQGVLSLKISGLELGPKYFEIRQFFPDLHGFFFLFFPTSSSMVITIHSFFQKLKNCTIRGLAVVHNSQKSGDEVSSLYSNYYQSLARCPNDVTYSIIVML